MLSKNRARLGVGSKVLGKCTIVSPPIHFGKKKQLQQKQQQQQLHANETKRIGLKALF